MRQSVCARCAFFLPEEVRAQEEAFCRRRGGAPCRVKRVLRTLCRPFRENGPGYALFLMQRIL